MTTLWPAPAKLNLFLYITGRRSDGYHNIQTIFQLLDYSDMIKIEINNSGDIDLLTDLINIPKENNLIIKAATLLKLKSKKILPLKTGAFISIQKKLPIGSGLGGGSSNAATVLVALNYLWKTQFTVYELATLGLQLGADIPVFIYGFTAFAEGIGEKIRPIKIKEKWYLIVYPNINISTSEIFSCFNLTRNNKNYNLQTLLHLPFSNDFEKIVRTNFIQIDNIISFLLNYAPTRLTGTGSCVFSVFDIESKAYDVLKLIPQSFTGFVAKGINISPLRKLFYEKLSNKSL
ncbi:4-(cytidine 5'-diphospho)-2-C-methyl-D-erythritol kinase [Candidatus Pantoea edessiphila]|uniref:4-diphosphocytidyl-2-C-methyl-D-erythritol kinase n=1 Tax=Candidatus Pantoea edessiphila TaxID=2044610 RepID=A0A2P5T361_9GAMM|nr:4-(cytidine 5'-diphospho)-2-C-methyl-D-erythritol kinase [Candidatus Pantoea edessiphila]PPI88970.1 4-(cytidine 5'-diphospho)-2-C-methyl-D-erythritol kinase [Candidatus Pantoea edessiphila]